MFQRIFDAQGHHYATQITDNQTFIYLITTTQMLGLFATKKFLTQKK